MSAAKVAKQIASIVAEHGPLAVDWILRALDGAPPKRVEAIRKKSRAASKVSKLKARR